MARRLTIAIACAVVSAAAAAQETPRRTASDTAVAAWRAVLGQDPFDALRRWAQSDRVDRAAFAAVREQHPAEYHELALCALWSDDADIAFAAACHTDEGRLDLRDIGRCVEVTRPRLFDEDLRFDWDTFKHVVDVDQVGGVLAAGAVWRAEVRGHFVVDLHRSFRPEHVPALAQLAHHADPIVRAQAFGSLALLSRHGDAHRETIALALLSWPGPGAFEVGDYDDPQQDPPYAPRSFALPEARDGWSPLLRAALSRWFAEPTPAPGEADFDAWLLRQAEAETPASADRAQMLELLASPRHRARWIALRGLLRLWRTPAGALADIELDEPVERALLLAARGELAALRAAAETDATALAVALEHDFDAASDAWADLALGDDAALGLAAIERLAEAIDVSRWGPTRLPAGFHERMRAAIEPRARTLDAVRLSSLLRVCAEFRTSGLAARLLERLGPDDLAHAPLAVLELHDEAGLRRKIEAWAIESRGPARDHAIDLAQALGAPRGGAASPEGLGDAVVARARRPGGPDRVKLAARADLPAVQALLDAEFGRADAHTPSLLVAAARARGVPEVTCRAWQRELEQAPAGLVTSRWHAWRKSVSAGDPIAALVDLVDALPAHAVELRGLGLVEDPRVLASLRRLRASPGARVQWVIGELALAGDALARAELAEVRERGLYGWLDDSSPEVRTLGASLELVPWWIDELGTVCCRRNVAAVAIEHATGFDPQSIGEEALETQRDLTHAWWQRVAPHLRWSRIAQRFEVAPH